MRLLAFAVLAVEAAAAAGLGPVDAAAGLGAAHGRAGVAGGVVAGRGAVVEIVGPGVDVGLGHALGHMVGFEGFGVGLNRFAVGLVVGFVALEQGIALQLALDIGLQFEVRQLQQLDRLLQLRRDDEALPLPKL